MNPGIDFFHLPSYSSGWAIPGSSIAQRVCPEHQFNFIPGLAWAIKEAAWKSLPDPIQPGRFHPSQFRILEFNDLQAQVEFLEAKRPMELNYAETHQGFLAYCLPESYILYQSIPAEYSKSLNGRPMMQAGLDWLPISISHDGPFGFSVIPSMRPK